MLSYSRNEVSVSTRRLDVKLDATAVEVSSSSTSGDGARSSQAGRIELKAGWLRKRRREVRHLMATSVIASSYTRRGEHLVEAAQRESPWHEPICARADDADPLAGPWRAGSHRVPTTRLGEVMTDYARDGCASLRRATRADLLARTTLSTRLAEG